MSFIHGIGSTVKLPNRERTLAQLERDIAEARSHGAPDDATVVRTGPASTYIAEILWSTK